MCATAQLHPKKYQGQLFTDHDPRNAQNFLLHFFSWTRGTQQPAGPTMQWGESLLGIHTLSQSVLKALHTHFQFTVAGEKEALHPVHQIYQIQCIPDQRSSTLKYAPGREIVERCPYHGKLSKYGHVHQAIPTHSISLTLETKKRGFASSTHDTNFQAHSYVFVFH